MHIPGIPEIQNRAQRGHSHPAFTWIRSEEIPSLNLQMHEYRHTVTGAAHYHLESSHPENVFLVAFRTVPMDSSGVAHILEHTALCGSQKYPVRDPFFMMIRRSLNTFMNAFTSSDWTAYPFASMNRKDYFNLLDVYLDSVFFARLNELDFAQEGHRLEFSDPQNPESQLQFKGVVFNEMKGAMSSTNSVLWQTLSKHLFPTTTYHYNSGGDPADIPDLTHAQLRDFYQSHYHPSNAVFMTFGDIPALEIQERIENLALSRFERLDINIHVDDELRFSKPRHVEEAYVCEEQDLNNKTHVVCAWLLGKSIDLAEQYRAQLLSSVLLDNSASPLLLALETSNLGTAPSPLCGLEEANREMSFMCGLEGCARDARVEVEALVIETLEQVVRDGVPQEQVEAALHQLELHQREISGDSYPYGLQLILAGLSSAVHRGDPISLLNIDPVLETLREEIRNPRFIPELVQNTLLDNRHRVTLSLQPDATLAEQQMQAEMQKLQAIRDRLSDKDISRILSQTEALEQRQLRDDDPDILPKVGLEDIPQSIREPLRHDSTVSLAQGELPVSFYGQGTNGLAYQQIVTPLPRLADELLDSLPLFTSCLPELGIDKLDYTQVQTWQSQVSGGVSAYSTVRSLLDDEQQISGYMVVSSRSLRANHPEMSSLLQKSLFNLRLDEAARVREIVEQICARRESSITSQGHSLAVTLASSRMSPTAQLHHRFSGLEGIRQIKALRSSLVDEQSLHTLLERFNRLQKELTAVPHRILLIAEPEHQLELENDLRSCWQSNATANSTGLLTMAPVRDTIRQVWTTTTQVSFCAKAYPTVASGHPDFAPLTVLAGYLRNGFLHRAVREQGGAYGSGAEQDANAAAFRLYSYRDPRLDETLADFDRALDWMQNAKHPARLLEEAILGVISAMDKSTSPAGEAKRAYYNHLFGRSLAFLTEYRQQVLAVSLADLRRVADRWLKPEAASVGVITSRHLLAESACNELETINL